MIVTHGRYCPVTLCFCTFLQCLFCAVWVLITASEHCEPYCGYVLWLQEVLKFQMTQQSTDRCTLFKFQLRISLFDMCVRSQFTFKGFYCRCFGIINQQENKTQFKSAEELSQLIVISWDLLQQLTTLDPLNIREGRWLADFFA